MERKLVLQSCLTGDSLELLEMYILLTVDVIEFDLRSEDWDLDMKREQLYPDFDVKLDYYKPEDFILTLLIARCPVSTDIMIRTRRYSGSMF